jgi:hypothetical protein
MKILFVEHAIPDKTLKGFSLNDHMVPVRNSFWISAGKKTGLRNLILASPMLVFFNFAIRDLYSALLLIFPFTARLRPMGDFQSPVRRCYSTSHT